MKLKKQFVAHKKAIFQGVNGRKYITIHETANPKKGAGAQSHANLQTNGFSASWHWQVDDQLAIQSYPHTVQCQHAGDGRGAGNLQSIAIEICVNEDSHYLTAIEHAATLTKKIMAEENIPLERVVMHHHWSGKNCPNLLRSGKRGGTWSSFTAKLKADVLKFGSTGEAVETLQKNLNELDFHLQIDASFGRETERAVSFLQSMHGLTVDGTLGQATEKAIERLIKESTGNYIRVLQIGVKGKAVEQLQLTLRKLGFTVEVDQSFGLETKKAVQQFQKKHQLEIDGSVGPITWAMLKKQAFR